LKPPKVAKVTFKRGIPDPRRQLDSQSFTNSEGDKTRVMLTSDGRWIALFCERKDGSVLARLIPADGANVDCVEVDAKELVAWLEPAKG
jgi:hypothetical protein